VRLRWSDHAMWWHAHPLGLLGAEPAALPGDAEAVPRLRRLEPWLDHLVALGLNGLLLGPVFASETHGYDTVDHFRVDPRLGTEDDLVALIEAARSRGVHVLLDGVFNHVGRGFAPFADVAARGAASPYARWFKRADGDFAVFEGHGRLVELDHSEPAVGGYVAGVMEHWLERGIAGWRLDAAYAVGPRAWAPVVERVRARFPEAWLVGEVIHGDYAAYVAEGGLDSVTQYELWKAIWSALNDANLFELAWALDRHDALLERFAPLTFVGNHDVTRIASRLRDERHLAHALVILFTVGGVPAVYAGDEHALRGVKEEREGGDDAIRPAFPDDPAALGADGDALRLHRELIGLRRRHPWLVRARTEVTALTNTAMAYVLGNGDRDGALAVALNVADAPARVAVPGGAWTVLAGAAGVGGSDGVEVPGLGWAVLGR
jgi:glycosidase